MMDAKIENLNNPNLSCDEFMDEVTKHLLEADEKQYFIAAKLTGQFSEAVLVMNPKHKGQMGEFLYVSGLKIPVLYGKYVEEDKAYMITDKELAKNVREMYESNT